MKNSKLSLIDSSQQLADCSSGIYYFLFFGQVWNIMTSSAFHHNSLWYLPVGLHKTWSTSASIYTEHVAVPLSLFCPSSTY